MKKLFTPLLLFLSVLLGGISASAEDEIIELTGDMFHQWDGYGADAKVINPSPGIDNNIGEGYEGGMFLGTSGVAGDIYADLTDYKGIEAEGTPGLTLRLLFNRPTQNDGITECNATFDNDGKLTFLFSNVKDGDNPASFIHLNAVKSWGNGTVKYMKLIPKPDPLELNADWFHQWDGYDANAKVINTSPGVDDNIGEGYEGGMFLGTSGVAGDIYADLTDYKGIVAEGTPELTLRLLFNRPTQNDGITECNATFDKDGNLTFLFSNVKDGDSPASFIHLNAVKSRGNGTVKYMKLIPKPDANTITGEWWHQWDGFDADAQIIEAPSKDWVDNIGLDLNGGDFIIGNSACDGDCYADLTNYGGIEGVATPGTTVRFYFNRIDVQGAGIDYRVNSDADGKYTCLFKDVKDGDGNPVSFVHLAFVKIISNEVSNPKVESMKVIAKPDPTVEAKEKLQDVIDHAKLYDSFAKTAESFAALKSKIEAAETAMNAEGATVESLAAAGAAITEAIEGLKLEEGYKYLTAEMFMTYPDVKKPGDVQNPGEGSVAGCAYDIFKATGMPYGDGNVNVNTWADLTGYDKLIITTVGETTPRIMMNREFNQVEKDGEVKIELGAEADTQADSKMLEMAPGNGRWSTKEYLSSEGNVYSINLKKIVNGEGEIEGYGFAHLNAIKKNGWGADIFVTGMYLYTSTNELELPLEALRNKISEAEQCNDFLKTEESWNNLQTAIAEGKDMLKESKPSVESIEAATAKITEAIAGLTFEDGYSELPSEIFKHYTSVENPGEGENTTCRNIVGTTTDNPYGDSGVSYLNWADLTNYDELIIKLSGDTKPRVMMNRMVDQGPDADKREDSKMLEMHPDQTRWSTTTYTTYDADKQIFTIKVNDIVDDFGFARLNSIKFNPGQSGIVSGMYLYKDATEEFNLSFNVDDPSHVVVKVNDETQNLTAGNNDVKVANRAKLFITSAAKYKISSLTANNEEVALKNDTLTKTIVKAISFTIVTEDANPLQQEINKLNALIEKAKLYDNYLKEKTSWDALQATITTAETEVAKANATKASLDNATSDLTTAIKELALVDDYYYLTTEMYKKYASVEEPGAGEPTECAYVLFEATENAYGNSANSELEWADLSDYDSLIITTYGNDTKPLISLNRLVAGGQQASTKEESKMIDINPYVNDYKWSTEKYQKIEDNSDEDNKAYTYIIDLKQIVKDFGFARLHSITRSGWNVLNPSISGLYLYKNPFISVEGIALDKTKSTMTLGETLTINATVTPDDATDPTVTWSSSNEKVATVDENGNVTATGVGTATITATCGTEEDGVFSASCDIICYPQVGDADWNSGIRIADAIHIANYIVGKKTIPTGWTEANYDVFYKVGADVNNDNNVSISDASATVEIALKNESEPAANAIALHSLGELADNLVIGELNSSANGTTTVAVTLDNTMEYVALQADIYVPEGVNFEVKPGSRIADSHSFQYYRFDESHVRVAIYTFNGEAFADNNEPLFEIIADSYLSDPSDISLAKIYASDSDANEHVLGSRYSVATGVAALGFDSNAPVKVFDLNGRYISDKVEGLGKGIYIIRQGNNAKKVNIR